MMRVLCTAIVPLVLAFASWSPDARRIMEGVYKQDYGKYVSKKLLPKETAIEPARALIVFEAVFEKRKVKVSANFVMEQDAPKIVQLRMEPL